MSKTSKTRDLVKKLVPMDDIMFRKMAEEKLFCQEIIRVIIGDPNLVVLENTPQLMVANLQGRSVILDAYCKLSDGREINIEVQKADNDDHQRRVRYNGALLTANLTDPGTKFDKVPDVCVIFISRFDMFKFGLPLYHVDRIIRENGKPVDNGFEEIYVNSAVKDESEVADLMNVFVSDKYYSQKFPFTSAGKHRYKETEEGLSIMSEISELLKDLGREEGREKGREEGHEEINALFLRLSTDNRMDDFQRAMTDKSYQNQLLKEMFPDKKW